MNVTKTVFFTSAIAIAIGLAAPAWADDQLIITPGGEVEVNQLDAGGQLSYSQQQTAVAGSRIQIDENGNYNTIALQQSGLANVALVQAGWNAASPGINLLSATGVTNQASYNTINIQQAGTLNNTVFQTNPSGDTASALPSNYNKATMQAQGVQDITKYVVYGSYNSFLGNVVGNSDIVQVSVTGSPQGNYNQAKVNMNGNYNTAIIAQAGQYNKAVLSDNGNNWFRTSIVTQTGNYNNASINTSGQLNQSLSSTAVETQTGTYNTAEEDILNSNAGFAQIIQTGNYNNAITVQGSNVDSGGVQATGAYASVTQSGNYNQASISQLGLGNKATIAQNGSYNTAVIAENGTNQYVSLTQNGSHLTLNLAGSDNKTISVTQTK